MDIHVYEFDHQPNKNSSVPEYRNLHYEISALLRPDVLYVTVSQDDQGLHRLVQLRPNILVFSAGGSGHIAIPLVKGHFNMTTPPESFDFEVGFYGNIRPRLSRAVMLAEMRRLLEVAEIKFKFGQSSGWKEDILTTKFNLAPRGFGRSSYRLAEIVQLGRIPVLLYDDVAWYPYPHSNKSVTVIGYVGQMGKLSILVDALKSATAETVQQKMALSRASSYYYTYEGVISQIERFFTDPLGPNGGDLRCVRVPDTDKRMRTR